jgi:hypothetical protein
MARKKVLAKFPPCPLILVKIGRHGNNLADKGDRNIT